MSAYPFRKVSLVSPDGSSTSHVVKGDPVIERLLADGHRIYREWEVLGPGETRTIFEEPI